MQEVPGTGMPVPGTHECRTRYLQGTWYVFSSMPLLPVLAAATRHRLAAVHGLAALHPFVAARLHG